MIQLVTIILLPLTVILLVITIGSVTVHQRAMRSMVGERDSRLVSTAARALSAQIDLREKELAGFTQMLSVDETQSYNPSFARAALLFPDFDKGLAILDGQGDLITASGNLTLWDRLADDPGSWTKVYSGLVSQPGKLLQMNSPMDDTPLGLIAYPIDGEQTLDRKSVA